jgi:ABC-type Fe3+-hydroxamate transport system substrate-binding protein
MKPLYIPLFAALFAMAPCAPAQTSGSSSVTTSPGAARAEQTTKTTATVTAVDPVHRTISMQRPDGRIIDVQAGAEVKNFDKIKVGDKVTAEYTEALSLELKKGKVGPARRIESRTDVSHPQGPDKPNAAEGATVTVLADVVAVNQAGRSVTLRGPEGHMVDLRVPNPEQLKRIKQGDQVLAVYTEALAVKVEPAGASARK